MDLELQQKIFIGLECLRGNDSGLTEYFSYLESEYPLYVLADPTALTALFEKPLRQISEMREICESIVQSGQAAVSQYERFGHANYWDSWKELYENVFVNKFYSSEIAPGLRNGFNELISFYLQQLPGFQDEIVYKWEKEPEFEANRRLYEQREVTATGLYPAECPNLQEWDRHDITIEGLSYAMPVFTPHNATFPAPFLDAFLLQAIEILKLFIGPYEMDNILRPYTSPDLSVYFWGRIAGSVDTVIACGEDVMNEFENRMSRGIYNEMSNRVFLNVKSNEPFSTKHSTYLDMIEVPIHEFGHAIHSIFVTDPEIRRNIYDLYRWSKRRANSYPEDDFGPVPFMELEDDDEADLSGSDEHIYALYSDREFFAEMFTEYITDVLMGYDDSELPYARRARHRIMEKFLEGGHINVEAFSRENISNVLGDRGISYVPDRWLQEERFDVAVNTNSDVGSSIYVGMRQFPQPESFGMGAVFGFFSPADFYDPTYSLELEGSYRFANALFSRGSSLDLESFGRIGVCFQNGSARPILDIGARIVFRIFPMLQPGPHIYLGAIQQFDFVNERYPLAGFMGIGYSF